MSFDVSVELNKTFRKAIEQSAARALTSPEDWAKHRTIQDKHAKDRERMQESYKATYDKRVDIVRRRLIDEAGAPTNDHPTPTGRDRFNPKAINTRAHMRVREEHEADLERSRNRESDELLDLRDEAQTRQTGKDRVRGTAQAAFTRSVQRQR